MTIQISKINCSDLSQISSTIKPSHSENNNWNSQNFEFAKIPHSSLRANYLTFTGVNRLDRNMEIAQKAYDYVKDLNLVSTTKWSNEDPAVACSGNEEYKEACQKRMLMDRRRKNLSIDEFIETTQHMVPLLEVGNCAEHAIMTATYLKEKKYIKNFAMVAAINVQDPTKFKENEIEYGYNAPNHVFVVLDLKTNADLKDPSTWGDDAVIIDPWGDIMAPAINKTNPKNSGISKIIKLLGKRNVLFRNYANYIDPTKDKNTAYNWENYMRSQYIPTIIYSDSYPLPINPYTTNYAIPYAMAPLMRDESLYTN